MKDWNIRNLIAISVTVFVLGLTGFIAVKALCTTKPDYSFVAQTLLPLWGTWLGTLLAYYFGKENFEAASKSYQQVIEKLTPDQKLKKISVKDVMIPFNKLQILNYEDKKGEQIQAILLNKDYNKYNRLAVFESNNILKCMIHRSTFTEYLFEVGASAKPEETTIESLVTYKKEGSKIPDLLKRGFNFVPINASLLDAKTAMDAIPECQDVFVTQNGKKDEPVLGLITNNKIFEQLQA